MATSTPRAGHRKSGIKRAPARRTPRKAKAGSRGFTPEQCRLRPEDLAGAGGVPESEE